MSAVRDFCWCLDEASVRSTPALTEDGGSSGSELEPNGDDDDDEDSDNEQQNDIDDDDDGSDDDDDEADAAAENEQLEADVMKQLGLFSWFSVPSY